MTPERARLEGRARGRIGMSDRIPPEIVVELSDEGIDQFHEGHAEGVAVRALEAAQEQAA